jgi:putative ATP-dependent endonuclease of OLD family
MIAIQKVKIKNFKKYSGEFEVKLKTGMNILVGDNESGKSTILEAIHLALSGIYGGRSIRNQLSSYLFNKEVVAKYLMSLKTGHYVAPPEILIEVYFYNDTIPEYEGNGNSEKKNGIDGICFKIAILDDYLDDYNQLCMSGNLTSIPIEYYEATWTAFSRMAIMPRNIKFKSLMIDSSNYRYQNGSDIYISRAIKEFLEPDDITSVAQAHRKVIDDFAKDSSINAINEKISNASTIMNEKITLSADQGVQNSWESSLVTQIDDVPFAYAGKGAQCIIKTQLALTHKKAENAGVILLEEPESHLSFSRLNELLNVMEKTVGEKQLIISTHSSFVANKLGLDKLILLSDKNCMHLGELNQDTQKFFKKISGYDTLRFILCKKAILVEGDSDELIVQRAYMDMHSHKLPIEDGIDVMAVGGVTFRRYLEIAKALKRETSVVTDNDGDVEAVRNKYSEYNNDRYIKICYDKTIDTGDLKIKEKPYNYNTLEPKLLKVNNRECFNRIFNTTFTDDDELRKYMQSKKTECAISIFESNETIHYPDYIIEAISNA